jgi:hypothetical protein
MAEASDHFPTRGPAVLVVTAIMLVLSTVFVVLRMISRIAIVRKVTLDDYFMILSWVCSEQDIGLPIQADKLSSSLSDSLLQFATGLLSGSVDTRRIYPLSGIRL